MGKIRPHLVRYWLHSFEKAENPETFAEKVNEICAIYQNASAASENGEHTVSVDEMTGVQALEHKYPDKPVMPGKAARREFEYIRHGTTSLIGFFDAATGRIEGPYLNKTRTEADFVEAAGKLVETDPEAAWTFVCDGLNTHKSEMLVRFVYTPKHCSWLNQIEIWFGIINRKLLKRKSYESVQQMEESILRFIEQYHVTAHPFKWTYQGVPLTVWLYLIIYAIAY